LKLRATYKSNTNTHTHRKRRGGGGEERSEERSSEGNEERSSERSEERSSERFRFSKSVYLTISWRKQITVTSSLQQENKNKKQQHR